LTGLAAPLATGLKSPLRQLFVAWLKSVKGLAISGIGLGLTSLEPLSAVGTRISLGTFSPLPLVCNGKSSSLTRSKSRDMNSSPPDPSTRPPKKLAP